MSTLAKQDLVQVKIEDASGTMRDVSEFLDTNWLLAVDWGADLEQFCKTGNIHLQREVPDPADPNEVISLAPLITDHIAANRKVEFRSAVLGTDETVESGDWVLRFEGHIDDADWGGNASQITIPCRDLGGRLVDIWIEALQTYGNDVSLVPMEDVMQAILDNRLASLAPQILVEGDPDFGIREYEQQRSSLMDALRQHAELIGWDLRYRYHGPSAAERLTFSVPDHTQTIPDLTFGASEYFELPTVRVDTAWIRNVVTVLFTDENGDEDSVTVTDAASVAGLANDYDDGRRFLLLDETRNTRLIGSTAATALANAVIRDTAHPLLIHVARHRFSPEVGLSQLLRYEANGIHYNSDQDLAVIGYRHTISRQARYTEIRTQGKPRAGAVRWVRRGVDTFRRVRDSDTAPAGEPPVSGAAALDMAPDGTVSATLVGNERVRSWKVVADLAPIADGTLDAATPVDGRVLTRADLGTLETAIPGEQVYLAAKPFSGTAGGGDEGARIDDHDVAALQAPTVDLDPTQDGSTGKFDLVIADPGLRVTDVEFKVKSDGGEYGSAWLTTWDRTTGTPGTNPVLERGEDVALDPKHLVSIKGRVLWIDYNGDPQTIAFAHTFDADMVAKIVDASITFDPSGNVDVQVEGDEDCENIYLTVGVDDDPLDPTDSVNDGDVAASSGLIETPVPVNMGSEAVVKVRGANDAAELGPVRTFRKRRGDSIGIAPGGNLAAEPSFESAGINWPIQETGWSVEKNPSNARTGSYYAKFDGTAGTGAIRNGNRFSVRPGQTYRFRAWGAGISGADGAAKARLSWLDENFDEINTFHGSSLASDGDYHESTGLGTAPAGAVWARVEGVVVGATTGLWRFDDFHVVRAPSQGEFGYQRPTIRVVAIRTGDDVDVTLDIEDPFLVVTAIEKQYKDGGDTLVTWAGWTGGTGTIATDDTLQRLHTLDSPPGLDASFQFRITFEDENGVSQIVSDTIDVSNLKQETKTLTIPWTELRWQSSQTFVYQTGATNAEALVPGTLGVTHTAWASIRDLVAGVVLTEIRSRVYVAPVSGGAASTALTLYRRDRDDGTNISTMVDLLYDGSGSVGWLTQNGAMAETVGDNQYIIKVALTVSAAGSGPAVANARFLHFELDYDAPAYVFTR